MQTIFLCKFNTFVKRSLRSHLYHKAVADISGGEVLWCFVDGKVFARQGGQVGISTLLQRRQLTCFCGNIPNIFIKARPSKYFALLHICHNPAIGNINIRTNYVVPCTACRIGCITVNHKLGSVVAVVVY